MPALEERYVCPFCVLLRVVEEQVVEYPPGPQREYELRQIQVFRDVHLRQAPHHLDE